MEQIVTRPYGEYKLGPNRFGYRSQSEIDLLGFVDAVADGLASGSRIFADREGA
ncbi:MAG: hypothetical protein JRN62_03815 [Nitrososphaerota archaeon]|jgi:hypothetical protein|nr:hypothetical protein [Nitrososphaerota archaeon]MDG6948729.1 hypothetical protein [Nitrososphaerota archaeon]